MLLNYMIDHIKQDESGSKTNATKKEVDALFDNMKLSYTKNHGDDVYFTQGQDLVTAMVHTIKHQKVKIDKQHIQDLFISNMFHSDDIKNIVAVKYKALSSYIQY